MSVSNWSRFARGKGHGMLGVSKSKKAATQQWKSASGLKKAAKARKPNGYKGKKALTAPDEARWRAEDDARTLQRASEIMADKRRVSKAKQIAEEQAKAAQEAAAVIRDLEGGK